MTGESELARLAICCLTMSLVQKYHVLAFIYFIYLIEKNKLSINRRSFQNVIYTARTPIICKLWVERTEHQKDLFVSFLFRA